MDAQRREFGSLEGLWSLWTHSLNLRFRWDLPGLMHFCSVFHRSRIFTTPMNQVRYRLSTYFVAGVVLVCLSTHTLGIIASKSGFSVTVPRAESEGVRARTQSRNPNTKHQFQGLSSSFGASQDHRWEH